MLLPLRFVGRAAVALAILAFISCGDSRVSHKVYPVKGKILVDGQPARDCQIVFNSTVEDKHPVKPNGTTNENGEFQLTTYYTTDGAPEGEYVATIEWRDRGGKLSSDAPDRLGGAYASAVKNKGLPGFLVKVGKQPLDLPAFELKQSAEAKRKLQESKKTLDFSGPIGGARDK